MPHISENLQHQRVKLQCFHLHLCIQRTCSTNVWNCSVSKVYLCIQKQHQRVKLQHTNILRIIWTAVPACPENIAEQSAYPETTAACTSVCRNIPVYSCIFAHCVFKKHMLCTCVFTKRNCIQRTCSTHVVKLQMHPTIHIEYEIVSINQTFVSGCFNHLALQIHLCLYTLQYQSFFSYPENL